MSVNEIDTVVLLFPNEEWSNATDTADSAIAQLRPNISFAQHIESNLQTLSTQNADRDGTISGFLYVPDLDTNDICRNTSKPYVPNNVTHQANLPPTDFTLIAIAPWINAECTISYMNAAHLDPARAFLFYLTPNSTGNLTEVPSSTSSIWDLQDGGAWKTKVQFPVYAISESVGSQLMHQLSLYSGNMTAVPYGHEISELPGIDPRDYVRLYTQLSVADVATLPGLWAFFLIVLAVLMGILGLTSVAMHLFQRSRRNSLQRRVESGEVNLEALGIKRLTVPHRFIERLPLFIYASEQEKTLPPSPKQNKVETTTILERGESMGISSPSPYNCSERRETISSYEDEPLPQVLIVDDSTSNGSGLVHKFLPYSQPLCAICLEDFVSGVTEIRELPCGHIFHPECIDLFLGENSSLCPLCKKSALPIGYCPTRITNAMVRRERNLHRLRSRVTIHDDGDLESDHSQTRFAGLKQSFKRNLVASKNSPNHPSQLPLQPQPVFMTPAIQPRGLSSDGENLEPSRQEIVQQRIRELAAGQVLIRDPDMVNERPHPKWRKALSEIFPGFQ